MNQRILIVNTVQLNENSGTGHTLQNIFSLLPRENLMQLIVHPDDTQPVLSDVHTVFTPVSVCKLPYSVMRKRSANTNGKNSGTQGSVNIPKKGFSAALHEVVSASLDAFPVNIAPVLQAVEDFQPQVIYTCAATMRIMQIVRALSDRYAIPVVVHLMDDWPQTIYSSSVLSAPLRQKTLGLLKQLYKRSRVSFAVSEGLCEKYEAFSDVPHLPLMNPAVIGQPPQLRKTDRPRFLYAGALSLHRDDSLACIAEELCALRKRGIDNEFHIYAPPSQNTPAMRERFAAYGAQLHDYVSADKVYALCRSFEVLVFTESFDPSYTRFTRFSLSTKIPEYLAAGVPILAFLPDDLFSRQYLAKNEAACVCSQQNELAEACRRLCENHAYRENLADRGFRLAKQAFSEQSVKEKLLTVFGEQE